jgi:alkaline phosphatase
LSSGFAAPFLTRTAARLLPVALVAGLLAAGAGAQEAPVEEPSLVEAPPEVKVEAPAEAGAVATPTPPVERAPGGAPPGIDLPVDNPWWKSGQTAARAAAKRVPPRGRARNVVLFLGDGMGISTVTAARIFAGQQQGKPGEETVLSFETLPYTGLVKTYNTNQQVPDSAGTMTAILSGVKTAAGVLGLDGSAVLGDHTKGRPVPTLMDEAAARGLATGIVTNTSLTHATPAAAYAHVAHRYWENDAELSDEARRDDVADIARQLIEFDEGRGIDVMLGGGRRHFLPANSRDPEHEETKGARWDERDLTAEWQEQTGGVYAWSRDQFEQVDPARTTRLLGLFEPGQMAFELDREKDIAGEPSLSEMTAKALAMLSQAPDGFLLLVEGGRIDHAHHGGNAYRALDETLEFARAVQVVLDGVDPADTLVVVTADHGSPIVMHGYASRGNPILGKVVANAADGSKQDKPSMDGLGRPYTTLTYPMGPGNAAASDVQPVGPKHHPHTAPTPHGRLKFEGEDPGRPYLSNVDTTDPDYLQEAMIPRFGGAHSGEDVPVYAGGPGAAAFTGVMEQHVLYHAIRAALGWER